MVIKQRESSVCAVGRRLTQSREGRNGGWTASNLNELMSCGVCWDLQGSPNGFIYSSFSPTSLFMWSLTPSPLEAGSVRRAPIGRVELPKSVYNEKFSSLKWSFFLVAQRKRENHALQVERLFSPCLWASGMCVERLELRTGVHLFLFSYHAVIQRNGGNVWASGKLLTQEIN